MKQIYTLLIMLFSIASVAACNSTDNEPEINNNIIKTDSTNIKETQIEETNISETETKTETNMEITLTIGSTTFKAKIEDTETGKAFIEKLPLTLKMSELNGNEKYYYLDNSLPRNDVFYSNIESGDLMLYSGKCIVLFYNTAGGYNYTRIGKLTSTEGLKQAVGNSSISIKFE